MFIVTHFLTVLFLVLAVSAHPRKRSDVNIDINTNAGRLARGLPLLRPRFSNILPGRSPTRVHAQRSSPSNVPVSGVVKVTRVDTGAQVGYIANTYVSPSTQRFGITTNIGQALTVAFTTLAGPNNVVETNGPDGAHPFLGFVVGPADSDNDLGSGSFNYILLTGTSPTTSGSPPAAVGNSYDSGDSESMVWTYDSSSLTAQWVNTDGSHPSTTLWYLPSANGLVAVGDPTSFSASFPGGFAVSFTIV
jgi:hypothetical protein